MKRREFLKGIALLPGLLYLPIVIGKPYAPPFRGVSLAGAAQYGALGATWHYNFTPAPATMPGAVAMLKRPADIGSPVLTDWLLLYNEPGIDVPEIENATQCAQYCREAETCYPTKKLVSPALWLRQCIGLQIGVNPMTLAQIVSEYAKLYGDKPRWDAVALHAYGFIGWFNGVYHDTVDGVLRETRNVMDEARALGYHAFWVTEWGQAPYACQWGLPEVQAVMRRMGDWIEAQPDIDRHAWFPSSPYEAASARWPDVALTIPQLATQYSAMTRTK
jgi:hypothetical protein